MDAKEYLGTLGEKWDIENYTDMWVPGYALAGVMESYHIAKSKEEAEENILLALAHFESEKKNFKVKINMTELGRVISEALRLAAFGKEEKG